MAGCSEYTTIDPAVQRLAQSVKELMPQSDTGWVKWARVAKHQEGSEHYADVLSALAELPQSRRFFHTNGKVVRLSDEGLRLADCAASQGSDEPITRSIAAAVRRYASRQEPIWLHVDEVWNVARTKGRFVQALRVRLSEETFPTETPVKFYPSGSGAIIGRIVGQEVEGDILYVAFEAPISLPGALSVDPGFLLSQLAHRLETLTRLPPLAQSLLSTRASLTTVVAQPDSRAVADELADLPAPWMRLLWGPPGSGKTYAIGRLVAHLLRSEPGARILVVAPSNRAADVALEQCIRQLLEDTELSGLLSDRMVLRFGYPRLPAILDHPEVLGSASLDRLSAEARQLNRRANGLEKQNAADSEIAVARAELLALQEEIKRSVVAHIRDCRLVATTTALAYLPHSPVAELNWDTVIVDEVTMVPPAIGVFLASLAKRRYLLAGDPRQLGPVYKRTFGAREPDFEWLGRDIFDKSRVTHGEGVNQRIILHDERLSRITSQRRCAAPIWDCVASLYPHVESLPVNAAVEPLAQLPPDPGRAVVLVDTSASESVAPCRKAHSSWENPFTGALALKLATEIMAAAPRPVSVAIITPYRAQLKRLRRALRETERMGTQAHHRVQAGTVHQFQGSEADVVIFDMVDGPGRSHLSLLLKESTGLRLVNVAITRARGKLIILADRLWCRRNMQPADNPLLWDLIMSPALR